MNALRVQKVLSDDGKIQLSNLPFKRGQTIEVILFLYSDHKIKSSSLSVKDLKKSRLIGMWKDRNEIQDSSLYARELRNQTQTRGGISFDSIR
ncbi:MAG: hypothetical protein OMM_08611 [Candidatus Magnetoglobus multicellularis str. Araruama]|uniref:Uncharacterized protein n=1 Tax=Candidatus Magnetoglobus multicellularis str. Araruama TaxID=890399 RepID=A0A1V1P7I9_9BACT|nr:MAG: hypothetical protein OMM_08611 [Candidatus Magnetoglobus multicellularis str. Araruama]